MALAAIPPAGRGGARRPAPPAGGGDLQRHQVVVPQQPLGPPEARRQQPQPAQQGERLGLGEEADGRRMHRARRLPAAAARRRRKAGRPTASACAGSEEQPHPGPVESNQRVARRLGRLQQRQRARRQQRRGALRSSRRAGGRAAARRPRACSRDGGGRGSRLSGRCWPRKPAAARPAARNPNPRSRPAWRWCRSAGRLEDRPPHQAAGLAVILQQHELQQRVVAAAGAICGQAEFVDIRVEPADPRAAPRTTPPRPAPGRPGAAGCRHRGNEDRPASRKAARANSMPALRAAGKPPVALPQQEDPAGMGGGEVQRGAAVAG